MILHPAKGAVTIVPGIFFCSTVSFLCACIPARGQNFAYVANSASGNVTGYFVDSFTPNLTPLPTSPFPAVTPTSVVVDPHRPFVYVTNLGPGILTIGSVQGWKINPVTGALTPTNNGASLPTGYTPTDAIIDATGSFLYVANSGSTSVSVYSIDQTTGDLTANGPPVATVGGPFSIALIAISGQQFAYVLETGGIEPFRIESNGQLTSVNGFVPIDSSTLTWITAVSLGPASNFLYVADSNGKIWEAQAAGGSVNVFGSVSSGTNTSPQYIVAGGFAGFGCPCVYAGNGGTLPGSVSAFRMGRGASQDGVLVPVAGSPFPTVANGTRGLAVNDAGDLLFAVNSLSNSISIFRIGPGGVLELPSFGVNNAPGAVPNSIALATTFAQQAFVSRYFTNLAAGESYINLTNTGANGASLLGPGFGAAAGNICVNVYAFDPSEEMISCCSCLVTPNQVINLGVNRDLVSNTLTGGIPASVTVDLITTLAGPGGSGTNCANSAASASTPALVPGLAAWGTTLHASPSLPLPPPSPFVVTEAPFTPATLSVGELSSLAGRCASILANGSGSGICQSCRAGGLGAAVAK
ncbi:MAG TPA: beta-propeller fold lactonase family protein [Bryobacteraceae bacterium]|jgi:6-phosphogluconolactonase (cycloisomerase 2 family)|nr:beta-propeller fold lactonase family protein [Bryobacteraceae bacterium]